MKRICMSDIETHFLKGDKFDSRTTVGLIKSKAYLLMLKVHSFSKDAIIVA